MRWLVLVYALGLAAGLGTGYLLVGRGPLWVALGADLVATLVVFAFSRALGNSSVYDPYWSVAPPVLALYWALGPWAADAPWVRQALVIVLVSLWGVRLTVNFLRGWPGLVHEDWRYVDIRKKTGRLYWPVSLLGIHVLPTLWVFGGCLSVFVAVSAGGRPFGWLDAVAAAVTLAAIAIEATADDQLRAFVLRDKQPGEIMDDGLWAWSRHPNYFGENLFWWGLWLFALAADPCRWWVVVGPLAITALFVFISIPMMEKRSLARRPAYAEHVKRVSRLVPRPPRRG